MRTLSATLTANQKSLTRPPILKLVLVKTGYTTQTYNIDSSDNRILGLTHVEQEWSQIADVAVNSDATLAALALEGYTGTISYGYNDVTNGDEYSACAPLEVIPQKTDTMLNRAQGTLTTYFSLAGVFNFMSLDEASVEYNPESTNADTVKTILTAIANATMSCFSHCKSYTITFDSEDTLINTYKPADYFSVSYKESRLSAFKRALGWTKCKARIERNTSTGVAEIHVFNPTISGTTYNYEYNDAVTYHNFFEKSVRRRLVLPNRIYVSSHPDQGSYTGLAADADSYAALGRYVDEHHRLRVTSNDQCTAIATAILQTYQVGQERGHGSVPMNCGQEVMDYINITDSVASDTRTGNVGYLLREYTPGRTFSSQLRFGALEMGSIAGITPPMLSTLAQEAGIPAWFIDNIDDMWGELARIADMVKVNAEKIDDFTTSEGELTIAKLRVKERLIIPTWPA